MRIITGFLFIIALATSLPARAAEQVSVESLLNEMVSRERSAEVPSPHYICRQFSSYDRDTVGIGKEGWFANWDRSQFVRVEQNAGRKEYVMLDAQGAGAVVHFWATWHGKSKDGKLEPFSNGTLRVYLDGNAEPAIEGPIADLISGGKLIGPPLSESVSPTTPYAQRGHNLYLPIPYQNGCKITYQSDAIVDFGAQKGEALYYQLNYRTYEPGTKVKSFQRGQVDELKALIDKIGKALVAAELGETPPLGTIRVAGVELPPKAAGLNLYQGSGGAGAIRKITLKLDAADREQALRSTVLTAEFDGEQTVWCPVGDFFGTGYQIHAFRSWYTNVNKDGTMTCYWVMPHEKSCRVSLTNLGDQPVKVTSEVQGSVYEWTERSMHFHAVWHQLTKADTGPQKDQTGKGAFDVNYVTVNGVGKIVGDTLTLFNGAAAWWGEGDEKIFIDGEEFPSHIGTGSEDYYGYAWCRPEFFQSPFHAQPCGDGNLAGGFSVNDRYRILDALPFTKSIKFDMELWHWAHTKINYAPSVFWYGRPGATCNVKPDPDTAALPVAKKRTDVVELRAERDALEGEDLKIVEKTGGVTQVQAMDSNDWSRGAQLWWIDGKPGDRLVLEVPVKEKGRYKVVADLTKAVDYAVVRLKLGSLTKEFDRFNNGVANDALEVGTVELEQGVNRLEIQIVGANEKALKRHMFGLDYLKLMKVE